MNENRLQVLQMLAAGQVSAEEAERLIAALDKQPAAPAARAADVSAGRPRYLRIVVDEQQDGGDGPKKVNIRVPFQLLRAGVRLASLIPNGAKDQINEALRKNGVPIDVTQLKPEDLDELVVHLADLTIDVEEKDTKVRIFAE
ncbi:SHOCT-like domain-containing protein [Krasilnikovia sp. MM14-A1004]|uniref:SHOCT-like domain-containing protein n=1 Tax=Krasilnikovia sp. MM14-A1004 TaxID=3373541 RepID=UPI00399C6153